MWLVFAGVLTGKATNFTGQDRCLCNKDVNGGVTVYYVRSPIDQIATIRIVTQSERLLPKIATDQPDRSDRQPDQP